MPHLDLNRSDRDDSSGDDGLRPALFRGANGLGNYQPAAYSEGAQSVAPSLQQTVGFAPPLVAFSPYGTQTQQPQLDARPSCNYR